MKGHDDATTRREALGRLSGFLAAGVAADHWWNAVGTAVPRVGLQLYTLRTEMQKSVASTLARVAAIGYREVEFAGYFNHTPKAVAALLEQHGLTAPAAHVPIELMRTQWDQSLDDAAAVGHQWVVIPYIVEAERTADGYRRIADELDQAGARARARGLRLGYHNHDFEFAPLGNTTGFEILATRTTPSLVEFELDLFWTTKGAGRESILAHFAARPGRFPLVHVKDMAADGSMVDVGAGTIDFRGIFANAKQGGIKHYFVEHDNPKDPFASVSASYRALSAIPAR